MANTEINRGKQRSSIQANQPRDFSGLQYMRGITPTDIDAAIDFSGKLFVFIEAKYKPIGDITDKEFSTGQRMALENICDAIQSNKKNAIAILAKHSHEAPQVIPFHKCVVEAVYFRGKWTSSGKGSSLQYFTDNIVRLYYDKTFDRNRERSINA